MQADMPVEEGVSAGREVLDVPVQLADVEPVQGETLEDAAV